MKVKITSNILGTEGSKMFYATSIDPVESTFIRADSVFHAEEVFFEEHSDVEDRDGYVHIEQVGEVID